jgi:hypothetical protein
VNRYQHACPLCENIPENILPLIKQGNSINLTKLLNEHIAKHMLSLSLISLPWLDGGEAEAEGRSIKFDESFKRLRKLGSEAFTPSQPDGIDRLSDDYSSLSFDDSPTLSEPTETSMTQEPLNSMSMWEIGPLHSDPRLDVIWDTLLDQKCTEVNSDPIIMALGKQLEEKQLAEKQLTEKQLAEKQLSEKQAAKTLAESSQKTSRAAGEIIRRILNCYC